MKIKRKGYDSRATKLLLMGGLLLLTVNCFPVETKSRAVSVAGEGREYAMEQNQRRDERPKPNPKLTPEQVVNIQLKALKNNDTPTKDSGIATAFEFASPGNRESTGPLERFILLVKNPLYQPMLNHRSSEIQALKTSDEEGAWKVTLIGALGERAVFVFTLSKQQDGPFKDCWMTDGVERVPGPPQEKDQIIARSNGNLAKNRQA